MGRCPSIRCIAIFVMTVCILGAWENVVADQEGRILPYSIVTADGRYIFVMARSCRSRNQDVHDTQLGSYTQTGLYRNDGSLTPLWTVDWCASVLLPSDGIHLIRLGPWASSYLDEAFTFFSNGLEIRSYTVRDLVDWPSLLPHTVSHYTWDRSIEAGEGAASLPLVHSCSYCPARDIDTTNRPHARTVRVTSLHGDVFVFDIRSGEILDAHRPLRMFLVGFGAALLIAYALSLFKITKRSRNTSLRERLTGFLTTSFLIGWWITILGHVVTAVWANSLIRTYTGFNNPMIVSMEAVWRLLFWLPRAIVLRLLNVDYGLLWSFQGAAASFSFWCLVGAFLLAAHGLIVHIATRLRRPGRSPHLDGSYASTHMLDEQNLRNPAIVLAVCVASLWILSLTYDVPIASFWIFFCIVITPMLLLLRFRSFYEIRAGSLCIGERYLRWHHREIQMRDVVRCEIGSSRALARVSSRREYGLWGRRGALIYLRDESSLFLKTRKPERVCSALSTLDDAVDSAALADRRAQE